MWYKIDNQFIELSVFAKPNAKKTALVSLTDDALHISLHAKPQEGAANKELIAFLAKLFNTPKTRIHLVKGENSRLKKLHVPLSHSLLKSIQNLLK